MVYLEGERQGEKGVKGNMRQKRGEENMRSGSIGRGRRNAPPCVCECGCALLGCFRGSVFVDLTDFDFSSAKKEFISYAIN